MITIERGSPAWHELTAALADPETRHISLNIRTGVIAGLAIKVNEHMWSPTLTAAVNR